MLIHIFLQKLDVSTFSSDNAGKNLFSNYYYQFAK